MRLKLLAICALIGGPILGYTTRQELNQRALIEKEGVTVPGIIKDGEEKKGRRGSKTIKLNVAYQLPSGKLANKTFTVPQSFADQYVKGTELVRDDVQVRCLPSDPAAAILVGAGDGSPEMEYIGYGLGVVGLVGTGFMFRRRNSA